MKIDLETAWELTRGQRWFSGHSREAVPLSVSSTEPVTQDPASPRSVFLDVGYPEAGVERYHLPVTAVEGTWSDACDHPASMRALAEALEAEAPGFTRFRELPALGEPRKYGGEQSNTSVFFSGMLLKVFRRLEPGDNLDVEIHRALAGTGLVADIFGVWQGNGTDLGIFLEALNQPRDGFVLAREHAESGLDFTGHAHALGTSLAAVHRGLAEAFPTATSSGARLRSEFEQHYRRSAAEVPQLRDAEPAVMRALEAIGDDTFITQRIHGDCHLGQVLLSDDRWRWVDFEGEPLKTLEERRRPDSALRDIAGMLRSFGYAAGEAASGWEPACRSAFLAGYGLSGEADAALLRAYEIDKAVYEVVYEARNRPTWIQIPLRALR